MLYHLQCVKSSRTELLHSHLADPPPPLSLSLSPTLWQKLTLTSQLLPLLLSPTASLPTFCLHLLLFINLLPWFLNSSHRALLRYCHLPPSLQRCATSTATSASLSHENVLWILSGKNWRVCFGFIFFLLSLMRSVSVCVCTCVCECVPTYLIFFWMREEVEILYKLYEAFGAF